jgi:hypothetical protein
MSDTGNHTGNQSGEKAGTRRLIIHCGVQKTASTSFHHVVEKNLDTLSPHLEILTPRKASLTRALGRAAGLFSLNPAQHEAEFVRLISEMRDYLLQDTRPCLISHENLPGAMLGRQGVVTLYPQLPRILALLDQHLAPFTPEYVFYTRDMMAWKSSVYNQAVKSDRYAGTRDGFLRETAACGDWDSLRNTVSDHAGAARTTFFRMEDEAGLPARQLLEFAGIAPAVLEGLKPLAARRNQSLNAGSLEFMRQINAAQLDVAAHREMARMVQHNQPLFSNEQVVHSD